jgi:ABC-type transporter Mla maintaining outer membrane lipid asymmetry permease subunit MlaE
MMPLLTIVSDALGMAGGWFMSVHLLGVECGVLGIHPHRAG